MSVNLETEDPTRYLSLVTLQKPCKTLGVWYLSVLAPAFRCLILLSNSTHLWFIPTIHHFCLTFASITESLPTSAPAYGVTALSIDGLAASRTLFEVVARQKWDITSLTIYGDIRKLNESDICYLIKTAQLCGSGLHTFILSVVALHTSL